MKSIPNLIIRVIDWFHKPVNRFVPIETFRYAVTGGGNTVLDIILYFIFYNYVFQKQNVDLGIVTLSPHIAAFVFVFPITFISGFILAKYITFTRSVMRGRIQIFRYAVSVSGSILLNYVLLKVFVEVAGLYATLSKIITTSIVIIYSFLMQKHFTFRTGKKALLKQQNNAA